MNIRAMQLNDLEAVVALERVCFVDPWSEGMFRGAMGNAAVRGWVACDEATGMIGYVMVGVAADEGEILNIAVGPAARGGGVGAALLERGLAHCRAAGARRVFLEVRESNATARRFYERHGFADVGRRRRYYRVGNEDAIVMCKILSDKD